MRLGYVLSAVIASWMAGTLVSGAPVPAVRTLERCAPVFDDGLTSAAPVPASPEAELTAYRRAHEAQAFPRLVRALPSRARASLERALDGLYFVDYGHAAPELWQIFTGGRHLPQARFPNRYDEPGQPVAQGNFAAFQDASRFLQSRRDFMDLPSIRAVNVRAMARSTEAVGELGRLRRRNVYGPEFEHGLDRDQLSSIDGNPYLRFEPALDIEADVPQGASAAALGDRLRGAIVYPRLRDLKPEALRRLRAHDPALAARVLAYRRAHAADYANRDEALTREVITALVEERIADFRVERARLGALADPARVRAYVELIARFQRDFISIHPFADGNGRTSRLLLYALARAEGLPLPRLVYPNEDVFWTVEAWCAQVRDGMLASLDLEADIADRLRAGLPVEGSVELVTPLVPHAPGAAAAYGPYLKRRFVEDPSLATQLEADPVGLMRRLQGEFSTAKAAEAAHENAIP